MARKLSGSARSARLISAALVALAATSALAQEHIQVSSTAEQVVNPFAARRQAAAEDEATLPPAIPPAEATGPKAYQNPFAARRNAPRFATPQLQAGQLTRWHRVDQPAIPEVPRTAQRPYRATLAAPTAELDERDIAGPLAVEEQRTALFALPSGGELPADNFATQAPPDPARFGPTDTTQPQWLAPHEAEVAAIAAHGERTARPASPPMPSAAPASVDPFDNENIEEFIVSDDAPPNAGHERPKADNTASPPMPPAAKTRASLELPALDPQSAAEKEPPASVVPAAPAKDAEQWYAEAERAAANAATRRDLAAIVRLCQQGLDCRPDPELTSALRRLAAWACNRSGEIESDQRREDAALKAFELAIQWDPNCWLALHNRAVSRAQQGDLDRALADFNVALQLNPGLAVAYRNRGELLAATGRTAEAVDDYTTALNQLPHDADLLAMRGEAYHRLGQYDDALADLSRSIELGPHNAEVFAQRGNVHAELGDFDRALADFRQALAVDQQSAEANRSLAWLLATCPDPRYRNPREALAAAERAAQLAAPGDPFVLDALAAAHAGAGHFDQAVRYQQEAIANVPADFVAPFQERLAQYRQHRPFHNGAADLVDENVRAASLETAPRQQ